MGEVPGEVERGWRGGGEEEAAARKAVTCFVSTLVVSARGREDEERTYSVVLVILTRTERPVWRLDLHRDLALLVPLCGRLEATQAGRKVFGRVFLRSVRDHKVSPRPQSG